MSRRRRLSRGDERILSDIMDEMGGAFTCGCYDGKRGLKRAVDVACDIMDEVGGDRAEAIHIQLRFIESVMKAKDDMIDDLRNIDCEDLLFVE